MDELYNDKLEEAQQRTSSEGMDLMGQLLRSKVGDGTKKQAANGSAAGQAKVPSMAEGNLTKDEILGNAFIMLVAGHETTANAMHFTLLQLAAHPAAQRQLQKDVDAIFGTGFAQVAQVPVLPLGAPALIAPYRVLSL